MTRVKSPSVRMEIGNVNNIRRGLRTILAKPNITPTTTAWRNDSTCTPANIYAETITAAAFVMR